MFDETLVQLFPSINIDVLENIPKYRRADSADVDDNEDVGERKTQSEN